MSGHSKWSTIKRKKAANDSKRGKIFTKLLKEVQVAARIGGGSVDGNPRLKIAVATAKSQSVPLDNIERSIKRGTGDLDGVDYEEIVYEGYGPGGVALLIKALTDNKNRTVAEVRHALSKGGGSLGGTNSVAFQFQDKGMFSIAKDLIEEEPLFEAVSEAGAEDLRAEGDVWIVESAPNDFGAVRDSIEALGVEFEGELTQIPETTVPVTGNEAQSLLKLLDALDDLDDIQAVVANFDIDESELEQLEA
jgi:YebC/PmpR family DNA-binding regulatory protein